MTTEEFKNKYCSESNFVGKSKSRSLLYKFKCELCAQEFVKQVSDARRSYDIFNKLVCPDCARRDSLERHFQTMGVEGRKARMRKQLENMGAERIKEASRKRAENIGYDGYKEIGRKQSQTIGVEGFREIHRKRIQTMGPEGLKAARQKQAENMGREGFLKVKQKFPDWFVNSLVYDEDKKRAEAGIISSNEKLWFICTHCGEEFQKRIHNAINKADMSPRYHLHGEDELWCKHCSNRSKEGIIERKVLDTLSKEYNCRKETSFFPHYDGSVGNYEGDIVSIEGKWCIEVDGTYWHTEGGFHPIGYHHDKDLSIEAKGYRVLHVTAEWIDQDFDKAMEYIKYWIDNELPTVHSEFDMV